MDRPGATWGLPHPNPGAQTPWRPRTAVEKDDAVALFIDAIIALAAIDEIAAAERDASA